MRKECKVITYHRWRVTFLLDMPVSHYRRPLKIRDFVWEIKCWDLQTLNKINLIFPSMKWIKKTYLPCIPLCFGVCLFFYRFFWFYCITTVTPFIRRSQGWSLRSARSWTSRNKNAIFSPKFQSAANFFSSNPRGKPLFPL